MRGKWHQEHVAVGGCQRKLYCYSISIAVAQYKQQHWSCCWGARYCGCALLLLLIFGLEFVLLDLGKGFTCLWITPPQVHDGAHGKHKV